MPHLSKSEKDYENADEIVVMDQRLLVYNAIIEGKSIAQLSRETGIDELTLKKRKKEVTATLTQGYHDELEYTRARTMARLEHLYSVALPQAMGLKRSTDEDGNPIFVPSGVPDRQWMRMLLEIMDREVAIKQADERFAADKREQGMQNLNYTNVQHMTIVSGNEMFEHARQTMWADFHGKQPDQLEQMLLETVIEQEQQAKEPELTEIKRRIDQIQTEIGAEVEGDDD